jgi:indole-3-glycerol phosphate synthase
VDTERFSGAIRAANARRGITVIPDIKSRSPKEGDLFRGRNPVGEAARLAAAGAPVLSVVTEAAHFGGSAALCAAIAAAVNVPILRKDFITSADEIKRSADMGAAAVLLICATVSDALLKTLYETALGCGLEPLVEAHTAAELTRALALGARLVGINNRDITAFETDDGGVSHSKSLLERIPRHVLKISESGILTRADVVAAQAAGADAALVGTALWSEPDVAAAYGRLTP